MVEKKKRSPMEITHARAPRFNRVRIVRVPGTAEEAERKPVALPRVNPRVTPEDAVKAVLNSVGGPQVIEQLRNAGKKL